MNIDVKALLKNKGLGYWLCLGAAAFALVMAIVVFATQSTALPNTVSGGAVIGVVLLIGVLAQAAFTFFPVRFASVVSVVCYGVAFGITVNMIPNTVADHFNQVNYTGGDFGMCMFYAIAILIIALAGVVSCFFAQTKDGRTLI